MWRYQFGLDLEALGGLVVEALHFLSFLGLHHQRPGTRSGWSVDAAAFVRTNWMRVRTALGPELFVLLDDHAGAFPGP